jgi:GPI mannosyltransferase 4
MFLVTPFPMKSTLSPKMTPCLVLDHRVFPHLDLDHIGESVEAGWRDGLSLGIWRIDKDCMLNTNLELD